jgi:MFS family permease
MRHFTHFNPVAKAFRLVLIDFVKRAAPKLNFEVLKLRDFRLLLVGRAFVFMALQAQAVIVGMQIYTITKSPLMLGIAGLAEAAPALICAIIAGHIVDQSRPQRVFVLCVSTMALNAFVLLMIAGGYVSAPIGSVLFWLYACAVVSGIARAFAMPSSFSLFPQIVPRNLISAGAAWMSSSFQLGTITAPAIAGLVYGGYGPGIAWVLPVGFLTASTVMLSALSLSTKLHRNERKPESAVKSIKAGWDFILKTPVVLSVMALDMFAVLFGGAIAMLPAYADQILHVGAEGFGLLRAAPAIGSGIIGFILAIRPLQILRGPMLLAAAGGFGLCMIGFGLSTSFALSLIFLIISGGFDNVSLVMRATILQIMTPPTMRGRVSGINSMFIISSNELGAFESGVAARLFGLVPSVVLGGIGTLIIVASMAYWSKPLWRAKIETQNTEA